MAPSPRLLLVALVWAGLLASNVTAKAVFAQFMVGNADGWGVADWQSEIDAAQYAKIDAFALNIAHGEATDIGQLGNAFQAANNKGFKLFFSFDYAGGDGWKIGGWPKDDVRTLLRQYVSNGAYYRRGSQPLVSTFEGPGRAADWPSIKSEFGVFFVPDWSSLGAKQALAAASGVADGLFNWAAWPWGLRGMDTYTDASYLNYLGPDPAVGASKYMMPVSPWFYTNMPGYTKNWMWNGFDLWHDRWQHVLNIQPEFVQIISWNDFGESHYIGPVRDSPPFKTGKARFDYVKGQTHDGWRVTLPYYIDLYKTGTTLVSTESVVAWYTLHNAASCDIAETTLNTATQEHYEFEPAIGRTIYFSAVLASVANVTLSVGGVTRATSWSKEPYGGVGVYHGNAQIGDLSGEVRVILKRNNVELTTMVGKAVGGCSPEGFNNFNPYVGDAVSPKAVGPKSPPLKVSDMVCIEGTGLGNFQSICEFNCKYTNCPVTACVCTKLGPKPTIPKWLNTPGYTKGDPNFIALCNYGCNLGYCPDDVCSKTQMPIVEPKVSPFFPDTCTAGKARNPGNPLLDSLCAWTCKYGMCPIRRCKCTEMGTLNAFPPEDKSVRGMASLSLRNDAIVGQMCGFACPFGACNTLGACSIADSSSVVSGPVCQKGTTSKDDWKCITCADSGKTILSQDWTAADQWYGSKAADSLVEFQKWYNDNYDKFHDTKQWFLMAVALFYGYTDGDFTCGLEASNGCQAPPECNSGSGDFSLENAAGNISRTAERFKDVFSPPDKPTLGEEFGKWLVSTVMDQTPGMAWKGFSIKTGGALDGAEDYYGQLQDFVTGKIDQSVAAAYGEDTSATPGNITAELSHLLYVQQQGVKNFVVSTFNASRDHSGDFAGAIKGGAWLKAKPLINPDLETNAVHLLYNELIPHMWQQRGDYAPVIVVSNTKADSSNPFGFRSGAVPSGQYELLKDSDAAAARLFGPDDKTFWLVQAQQCKSWAHDRNSGDYCGDTHSFAPVFGLSELDGKHDWGVSRDDVIISAWRGYHNRNGDKNGYEPSKDKEGQRFPDGTNFIYGEGARTPGLNQIPICDFVTAKQNAQWWQLANNKGKAKPCDTFPCCPDLKLT